MQRIAGLVLGRPWTIAIAFALACVGAQLSIERFGTYDLSVRPVTPQGSHGLVVLDEFEHYFGADDDSYVLAFAVAGDVLENGTLQLIEQLTETIEAIPDTLSVTSLTNLLDVRSSPSGMDVVEFVGPLPLSESDLRELRDRAPTDPLISGLLLSDDRRSTSLIVRMLPDALAPDRRKVYFDQLELILVEEAPDVAFHLTGWPFLKWTIQNHLESDATLLLPTVNVVFALLLWLAFRQLRMIWIPLLPVIVSSMMTVGTLVLTGKPMTTLTAEGLLTTLIMVIGLSDGVHLVDRYRYEVALDPTTSKFDPLVRAIKHVGVACFLTSVTTSIGFSGLLASELPTMRDFGIFGSLGIFYAFAASVLFLPACIVLVERRWESKPPPPIESLGTTALLSRVADFVVAKPGVCILAGLIILGGSIAYGTRVRIDQRVSQDLRPDDSAVVSMDYFDEHLGGSSILEVLVKGAGVDAMKDPAILTFVDTLAVGIGELEHVVKVLTPTEYIKKMNRAVHDGRPEFYVLPDSQQAVAQNLLLFEMAGGDSEFDRLIPYDYDVLRIVVHAQDMSFDEYTELEGAIAQLSRGANDVGVEVYLTGILPAWAEGVSELLPTLLRSLALAMPVIFLVMMIVFRSVKYGLLSALPNLLPLAVGMGVLGFWDISLRIATISAFPIAFGLAVDDTIHFLSTYKKELAAGRSVADAVRGTLIGTGRAMVLSTVFIAGGMAVLLLSGLQAGADMASVIIAVLFAALMGDLVVLPALLVAVSRKSEAPSAVVHPVRS